MKPRTLVRVLSLALAFAGSVSTAAPDAPKRVLFFTKSSGYEHEVIKTIDGRPSYAENVLQRLGEQHDFEFTFSKDGSRFDPAYLKQFDAVMFYTSGDLLSVGTDGHPAMTPAGKKALIEAIAGGMGFIGLHSASDSFHTHESGGGNPQQRRQRYRLYGDASDAYVKCLGGEFIRHGPQQVATALVTSPGFPGFNALGEELRVREEWYTLKEFAPDLHVQLVMQTEGMEGSDYQRPPYPLAWVRRHGEGRVAYNAMGHREDVWDSAAYQAMLVGVLNWTTGRIEADTPPNLEKVAPGHAQLQAPPPDMK